jgi:uncharacterized protein YfaP (DUF2135 family)
MGVLFVHAVAHARYPLYELHGPHDGWIDRAGVTKKQRYSLCFPSDRISAPFASITKRPAVRPEGNATTL